jgi:hypothetical protein
MSDSVVATTTTNEDLQREREKEGKKERANGRLLHAKACAPEVLSGFEILSK